MIGGQGAMEAKCEGMPTQMKVRDKLLREKKRLEERIDDIDRALALYDKNPDIEELTNLIGRII